MNRYRVLVLGGYGFFGCRLVERLSLQPGLDVLIAGRSHDKGEALVSRLQMRSSARLEAVALDMRGSSLVAELRRLAPQVVIDAAGPFQGDVPDLALLPSRYRGAPEVRFAAGLELSFLHRGMNLMAWMARGGWVKDWSRYAVWLKAAADPFRHWGSDAGAMHVRVHGRDAGGARVTRTWTLVATEGHGPFVPTLAAAALIRKFRDGKVPAGAGACIGVLSLEDFVRETDGLSIRTEIFE